MTIADTLPVVGIVLLGGGILLFLYFVWKVITTKPESKPPWDCKHKMRDLHWTEHFGSSPDDYATGWLWECTCGTGNTRMLPTHWPYTAEEAVEEFLKHKRLMTKLEDG